MSGLNASDKAFVDSLARTCLAILLLGWATQGLSDTDIWGHMAIGLDMIDQRRFFWTDPYSFTADQEWVNHEWLWDLITAGAFRLFGLPGVLAMRAALIGTVVFLIDRATRPAPQWIRVTALIAITVACAAQWQSTRPQIATLALYAIVLTNLTRWWLPLLFATWANLHGGWIYGLAALIVFSVANRSRAQLRLAGLSAAATLVNPYGVRLWTAIGDAMFRGWDEVSEWAPVWSRAAGIAPLWLWLALVFCVAALARVTRADRWAWAWTLVTFAAAARSRRLLALSAVTAALLLLPAWGEPRRVPIRWTPLRRTAFGGFVAGATAMALMLVAPTAACFPAIGAWNAPEPDATAYLAREYPAARGLVFFDFGEYAVYALRPRFKVSFDNRRETVYSDAIVQAHKSFYAGGDPSYPDRIGADIVWLPADSRALDGLERSGWYRRFQGPKTVILTRQPGPVTTSTDVASAPCFPHT